MLYEQYLDAVGALQAKFRETQEKNLVAAGKLIADSVAAGGAWHRYDTGHIKEEPIKRAGGLFAIYNIKLTAEVEHQLAPNRTHDEKTVESAYLRQEFMADFLLDNSHIRKGDVLMISSNSGRGGFAVSLALGAKKRGLKVLAITSLEFSKSVASEHSSGKKLYEVADVTVDNCTPAGDAVVKARGLDTEICPTSSIMAATALWCVTAQAVEEMLARGIKPSIYRSVNLPDGDARNKKAKAEFLRKGI
jgi:uncharacterized phosphosugar-binding protein